jgi:hypothetical protein
MSSVSADNGPVIPQNVAEGAEAPVAPPSQPAEAAKPATPEKPNKEQLFGRLEDSLRVLSQRTKTTGRNVEATIHEAGSLTAPLFDISSSADQVARGLEPIRDARSDDIRMVVNQAKSAAQKEYDNAEHVFGGNGAAISSARQVENLGRQDKFDQIMAKLKEAEGNTDEAQRTAGIDGVKAEIAQILAEIESEGDKVVTRSANFKDDSDINVNGIRRRTEDAYQMAPAIRERLGESYFRIRSNVENMLNIVQAYRGRTSRLETVPLEFKLLSDEAARTGATVEEILEAIKAAK